MAELDQIKKEKEAQEGEVTLVCLMITIKRMINRCFFS